MVGSDGFDGEMQDAMSFRDLCALSRSEERDIKETSRMLHSSGSMMFCFPES
jgi:hypothetical protein